MTPAALIVIIAISTPSIILAHFAGPKLFAKSRLRRRTLSNVLCTKPFLSFSFLLQSFLLRTLLYF